MTVPVVISATSLPLRLTGVLGGFVVIDGDAAGVLPSAAALVSRHRARHAVRLCRGHVDGASSSSIAFTGVYAWRVAEEARLLANALAATELVLQREQHLSALDGLAAAAAHELGTPLATIALVAKEMERALGNDARYKRGREAAALAERALPRDPEAADQPVVGKRDAADAAAADLADRGGDRAASRFRHRDHAGAAPSSSGPEPVGQRNPGVIYGLGNLVENAVDFAKSSVTLRWRWNDQVVGLRRSSTTGRAFLPDIIDRIGEPYMSTRQGTEPGGGLGLGLFIAKTLLERSGATISVPQFAGARAKARRSRSSGRAPLSWRRRSLAESADRLT